MEVIAATNLIGCIITEKIVQQFKAVLRKKIYFSTQKKNKYIYTHTHLYTHKSYNIYKVLWPLKYKTENFLIQILWFGNGLM